MKTKESVSKQLTTRMAVNYAAAVALITLLSCIVPIGTFAQGNLLITPRRVVFEGSIKTQILNLKNIGNDALSYNLSIIQIRMKEDGSFEEITVPDPGQNFADKNIRFFPRSVTLAPNETKVVKMQLKKTYLLDPGEYRSHLYFRTVAKEKAFGEDENRNDSAGISVQLVPIFGITIPVIIRVGESTTKVTLSNLSMEMVNDTLPRLKFKINRSGNMSVYGDLFVKYTSPEGKVIEAGAVQGIAVYTPNTIRRFQMDLKRIPEINYNKGKLTVIYSAQSDINPQQFAESDLILK